MDKQIVSLDTYTPSEDVAKHIDHVPAYAVIDILKDNGKDVVVVDKSDRTVRDIPENVDIVCAGYAHNNDVSELRRALIEYKLFDMSQLAPSSLISDYAIDVSVLTFNNAQACQEFCAWFIAAEAQLEQSAFFARYARYDGLNWSALLLGWALPAFARHKGYTIGVIPLEVVPAT